MKKLAVLSVAALAFSAACSDLPTALHAPQGASLSANTVNGPTWVTGIFTIADGSVSVAPGVNQHPQGKGTCRNEAGEIAPPVGGAEYTIWYNQNNQPTGSKFCQGSSGVSEPLSCIIDGIPATYAAQSHSPTIGGNENLNFVWLGQGEPVDQFVHYRANPKAADHGTRGVGEIRFTYSCTGGEQGEGTLELNQFNALTPAANAYQASADGRQLDTAGVAIATSHGATILTSFSWTFRSRVGL